MSLPIRATRRVAREIGRLPANVRRRVEAAVDDLSEEPYQGRLLAGSDGIRRVRVGDYRILYHVGDDTVSIIRVEHRSSVYRKR